MSKVKPPILVEDHMKVDEKSFIKAKIKHWTDEREKYQREIQKSIERDMTALNNRIAMLQELLYERFPEEKPQEPPKESDQEKPSE